MCLPRPKAEAINHKTTSVLILLTYSSICKDTKRLHIYKKTPEPKRCGSSFAYPYFSMISIPFFKAVSFIGIR